MNKESEQTFLFKKKIELSNRLYGKMLNNKLRHHLILSMNCSYQKTKKTTGKDVENLNRGTILC